MTGRRAIPAGTPLVVLLIVVLGGAGVACAQMGMGGGGNYALADDERNLKFAGVPIPGYSDVLGFNLGVVGMAYYKMDRHDDELPPSATGLFGFYSANNSWIGAAFQKFHLDGDKWRATAAFGVGSVKYQFNPAAVGPGFPDIFVDYATAMNFVYADGSRITWGHLYLGLAVLSWEAKVNLDPALIETPSERYTGPGFLGSWDRRDHTLFPTGGTLVDGRYLIYDGAFGSDREFQKLTLSANGYRALGDSSRVLAGRVLGEAGYGDVPFSAQSIVNGNRNLRGYANGRHRADSLAMVEAEYRWMFWGRWGVAGFAGLAWSADKVSEMSLGDTLTGAGLGVRWRMIKTYKINVRIDYAWGEHDQAVYFAIGEAF